MNINIAEKLGRYDMKFCSSKCAYAAFGVILAIGFLPDIASGQGQVKSGTATQVGGVTGKGQVKINGTVPLSNPSPDLSECTFTLLEILTPPGGAELVDAPACIGVPLSARRGSKINDAIFESDQRQRPTCRVQIKDRGRGELEFALKVDRVSISGAGGAFLGTAFQLDCDSGVVIPFAAVPTWRITGSAGGNHGGPNGVNIRTP